MDEFPLFTTLTGLIAVAASLLLIPKKHKRPTGPDGAPSPPFVPYYFPLLGSTLSVGSQGLYNFIRENAARFSNSEGKPAPIVTALVAGKRMHFIADPAAFDAPFRYPITQLSMGPVISDFVHSFFGMSKKGLENSFEIREGLKPLSDHLLKSAGLEQITKTVQVSMKTHLGTLISKQDSKDDATVLDMDLTQMVNKIMFRSVLDSVISPTTSHDAFLETYDTFEKAMMIAFVNLPMKTFAPKSFSARQQLVDWLSAPDVELSPYLKARREFLKQFGTTMDDQAKDDLLWIWGSVSNFLPTLFWMLYYVGTTPEALDAIREEVDPMLKKSGDEPILPNDVNEWAALASIFQETLRCTERFLISRQVMKDMEIDLRNGDKTKYFLQEGDQLIAFTPILQQDPELYADPMEFQWDRFVKNKDLPMRAFGGGAHYCPGRKFAANAAKAFVAHLVFQYDFEIDGVAEHDMARDGLGVLHSKSPVQIKLKKREDPDTI